MERMPLKLKIYALTLGITSLIFLLVLSHYFPFSPRELPFIILFITTFIFFRYSIPLPVAETEEIPVFPLVTTSIILYGPTAGAWLHSFAFFLSIFLHPKKRKDVLSGDLRKSLNYILILLMNMGWFTYSAGLAGLVWLYASGFAPPYECYRHPIAIFLVGLTYVTIDNLSESLAGALYSGTPFWKIWFANRSWNIYFAFLEVALGVLYVVIYYTGGILLLILGFSFLAVLRRGYLLHLEKTKILNLFMKLMHEQLEKLDLPTKQHCEMVGILAEAVGKAMGVPFWRRDQLVYAARLHDVGKIAIDEKIIESSAPLTPQQREEIRRHTSVPYHAMRNVPYLRQVGYWILLHHEKMDGSGYWGRAAEEIPLEARILGVVDAIHALTSPRPYRGDRPAYTFQEAIELLYEEAKKGKWDVKVLETMKKIVQNDERLKEMLNAR